MLFEVARMEKRGCCDVGDLRQKIHYGCMEIQSVT